MNKSILLATMLASWLLLPKAALAAPPATTWTGDGRLPLETLYASMERMARSNLWEMETVFTDGGLPTRVLHTRCKGPALWLIAGIHGEEPAPPGAVHRSWDKIDALARKGIPLVVFPLCNPTGYSRNWRYPNAEKYSATTPGHSVGDSDHLLAGPDGNARVVRPTSAQAAALTRKVLELAREYPPVLWVDLHEDNLLEKGYVYSQGPMGSQDKAAKAVIGKMLEMEYPVILSGTTRFGEPIVQGLVAGVKDGSIDELIASEKVILDGKLQDGPAARSVLVVETSSMGMPLEKRIRVHSTIIEMLDELFAIANKR